MEQLEQSLKRFCGLLKKGEPSEETVCSFISSTNRSKARNIDLEQFCYNVRTVSNNFPVISLSKKEGLISRIPRTATATQVARRSRKCEISRVSPKRRASRVSRVKCLRDFTRNSGQRSNSPEEEDDVTARTQFRRRRRRPEKATYAVLSAFTSNSIFRYAFLFSASLVFFARRKRERISIVG